MFFDYDHDGKLDLFLVNVGRYTTNTIAGEGYKYYVAFEDAFSGHLQTGTRRSRSILYHNVGKNHFVDVSQADRAASICPGRATRAWSTSTTTAGPICTS